MKTLFVFLLSFTLCSCGTISVPCDSVGTLAQEGATYLCNYLTGAKTAQIKSMTADEKLVSIGQAQNLDASIEGFKALALAQAQSYMMNGDDAKAQNILVALHNINAQQDTLHTFIKALKGN